MRYSRSSMVRTPRPAFRLTAPRRMSEAVKPDAAFRSRLQRCIQDLDSKISSGQFYISRHYGRRRESVSVSFGTPSMTQGFVSGKIREAQTLMQTIRGLLGQDDISGAKDQVGKFESDTRRLCYESGWNC